MLMDFQPSKPPGFSRLIARKVCCVALVILVLGTTFGAGAASGATSFTISVVNRLVVWAGPSLNARIVAVLEKGRHFTVDGRNTAGTWIHGITDRGTLGWLPTRGFLTLHPEVNLQFLTVLSPSAGQGATPGGPDMITVTVVRGLRLWAGPSLSTAVVATLPRGRQFTVDGRNAAGIWIYGLTDQGKPGWLPSQGFLALHPDVNLQSLPVLATPTEQDTL